MMKTNRIRETLIEFDKSLIFEKINPGQEITIYGRGEEYKTLNDYNIFTIPDNNVYDLYLYVSNEIKKYIEDKKLSFERLRFYCYARMLAINSYENILSLAPNSKTSFFAILNISNNTKTYIKNKNLTEINPFEIHIMDHSDKIKFEKSLSEYDILYISIASVDTLQDQLPSLWIPLK